MAAVSTSKKRKRDLDDTQKVSFALSDHPPTQLGPVLGECRWSSESKASIHAKPVVHPHPPVNFPSVKPTKSTPFKCYRTQTQKRKADNGDVPFAEMPLLIAGETEAVDFYSSDETRRASVGSRYVHTKTSSLILHTLSLFLSYHFVVRPQISCWCA
jgi:DNA-directed RNA polymerase I subunit RPA49